MDAGLEKVVAAETVLSDVMGAEGRLVAAGSLAGHRSGPDRCRTLPVDAFVHFDGLLTPVSTVSLCGAGAVAVAIAARWRRGAEPEAAPD